MAEQTEVIPAPQRNTPQSVKRYSQQQKHPILHVSSCPDEHVRLHKTTSKEAVFHQSLESRETSTSSVVFPP